METQTQEPQEMNMASTSLDALIDGLRVSDLTLHDNCIRALCAFGPRVAPVLDAAANATTSAKHRRRIRDTIERIEDTVEASPDVGRRVWVALLDCLRVSNSQLNHKAMEAISLFSDSLVIELVAQATYHRRKRAYAQRLMHAASRLGLGRRRVP